MGRCATQDTKVQVRRRKDRSKKKKGECLPLNRTTLRRSGQRRDVLENVKNQRRDVGYQRRDVPGGVKKSTSRRFRGVQNQRRDVGISSRDVGISRRDVGISRRDVPE